MAAKKKSAKRSPIRTAAVLTVRMPSDLTPEGVAEIAAWLRRAANDLRKHRKQMGRQMRWRFQYLDL